MIRTRHILGSLLFLALLPLAAAAQAPTKLVAGKWTGTVSPPDMGELPMKFEVKLPGDSIQISASLTVEGQAMAFVFNNAKIADGVLSFTFDAMGQPISCALKAQDNGSWKGDCKDAEGSPAVMTMVPPKKEGGLELY
jgi:hypothetical protein